MSKKVNNKLGQLLDNEYIEFHYNKAQDILKTIEPNFKLLQYPTLVTYNNEKDTLLGFFKTTEPDKIFIRFNKRKKITDNRLLSTILHELGHWLIYNIFESEKDKYLAHIHSLGYDSSIIHCGLLYYMNYRINVLKLNKKVPQRLHIESNRDLERKFKVCNRQLTNMIENCNSIYEVVIICAKYYCKVMLRTVEYIKFKYDNEFKFGAIYNDESKSYTNIYYEENTNIIEILIGIDLNPYNDYETSKRQQEEFYANKNYADLDYMEYTKLQEDIVESYLTLEEALDNAVESYLENEFEEVDVDTYLDSLWEHPLYTGRTADIYCDKDRYKEHLEKVEEVKNRFKIA